MDYSLAFLILIIILIIYYIWKHKSDPAEYLDKGNSSGSTLTISLRDKPIRTIRLRPGMHIVQRTLGSGMSVSVFLDGGPVHSVNVFAAPKWIIPDLKYLNPATLRTIPGVLMILSSDSVSKFEPDIKKSNIAEKSGANEPERNKTIGPAPVPNDPDMSFIIVTTP